MTARIKLGRYFSGPIVALLRGIHEASRVGRQPTETERKIAYLDYSLGSDFREGLRRRDHGFDARSVSERERERLVPVAEQEKRVQERDMLVSYRESLQEALRSVEGRLLELDGERGSMVLLRRQRELHEARLAGEKHKEALA